MISRVRRVFEIELAVRTVFEEPTIAELAERIEAANLAKVNAPGWLLDHEVTLAHLPATVSESLLAKEVEWPTATPLRVIFTSGERLSRYPSPSLPFEMINSYSLAECGGVVICGKVQPVTDVEHAAAIGRPIANTQVYILDEYMNPVPVGAGTRLSWRVPVSARLSPRAGRNPRRPACGQNTQLRRPGQLRTHNSAAVCEAHGLRFPSTDYTDA